jgi:RNA polymerase sigma factor (TIGR02999 family)
MHEVTRILNAIDQGDSPATEQLLPLLYKELRSLAARKMKHETPGQTLDATALVHEAYIRLANTEKTQHWNSRNHFYAAAAEAMRRILIENARRKGRQKRGGSLQRVDLRWHEPAGKGSDVDILAVDEALAQLAREHPEKAELVKLRYFAGLTLAEAAATFGYFDRYRGSPLEICPRLAGAAAPCGEFSRTRLAELGPVPSFF